MPSIRSSYDLWPICNAQLRAAVRPLTPDQVRLSPAAGRWPLWAVVGHLACQRVFWLSDFAGVPGRESTPFLNAASDCPGDDDLENVLEAEQLVHALDSTFSIVERCLDTWTIDSLPEEIVRNWPNGETWTRGRGNVIQRVFAHDISHVAEVNETLTAAGLPPVDLWQ
ncbi:MAG: DinB family protein [Dehalococcoidia bacterium]